MLRCQRAELIGLPLNESETQAPQLQSLAQLKQVVTKLEGDGLQGLLWRSQDILEIDKLIVSIGAAENADNVLSLMLYPLPALGQMVVEEFVTDNLDIIDTAQQQNTAPMPDQPLNKEHSLYNGKHRQLPRPASR